MSTHLAVQSEQEKHDKEENRPKGGERHHRHGFGVGDEGQAGTYEGERTGGAEGRGRVSDRPLGPRASPPRLPDLRLASRTQSRGEPGLHCHGGGQGCRAGGGTPGLRRGRRSLGVLHGDRGLQLRTRVIWSGVEDRGPRVQDRGDPPVPSLLRSARAGGKRGGQGAWRPLPRPSWCTQKRFYSEPVAGTSGRVTSTPSSATAGGLSVTRSGPSARTQGTGTGPQARGTDGLVQAPPHTSCRGPQDSEASISPHLKVTGQVTPGASVEMLRGGDHVPEGSGFQGSGLGQNLPAESGRRGSGRLRGG